MNHYMRGSGKNWKKLRFQHKEVNGYILPYIKEDPLKGIKVKNIEVKRFSPSYSQLKDSFQPNHSWNDYWPTCTTYNRNLVPFPMHQGYVRQKKRTVVASPPDSRGNLELLKIANFLHLTPKHIEKQCKLIKESMCTYMPKNEETQKIIEEELPLEIITQDFVFDSSDSYHEESRKVILKLKIDRLRLKAHERLKMIRILDDSFDEKTSIITIKANKCPMRKQNVEYALYLLYVTFCEAKKVSDWENDTKIEDLIEYDWEKGTSKMTLEKLKKSFVEPEIGGNFENIENEYKKSVKHINDRPDSNEAENEYKISVKRMFGIV